MVYHYRLGFTTHFSYHYSSFYYLTTLSPPPNPSLFNSLPFIHVATELFRALNDEYSTSLRIILTLQEQRMATDVSQLTSQQKRANMRYNRYSSGMVDIVLLKVDPNTPRQLALCIAQWTKKTGTSPTILRESPLS